MKRMKRIVSVLLAMVMVLGMSVTVFAAEGDKTITIKSSPTVDVTAEGKVFTAYKILDAQTTGAGESVVYTVPDEMKPFYNERYFNDVENPDQNVSNYAYQVAQKIREESDLYDFAEAALGYANGTRNADGSKLEPAVSPRVKGISGNVSNDVYVISGLEVGYYVIEDRTTGQAASQVMLDTTITNLDITVKADMPPIGKSINGEKDTDPGTSSAVDANNASVGDVVPYTLMSKVPAMAGYKFYRFVMSDKLSEGLTLNVKTSGTGQDATPDLNGSFTVKIGNLKKTEIGEGENKKVEYEYDSDGNFVFESDVLSLTGVAKEAASSAKDPAYYVNKTDNADGTTSVEIVFVNFLGLAPAHVGEDIVVEYSATLNEKAVIGAAGNLNTASLDYSNDPSEEGDGTPEGPNPYEFETDDPRGETGDVTVKTFVTALALEKVNSAGQTLAGAQFTIEGERLNKVFVNGMNFVEDENGAYWGYNGTYTTQGPEKYEGELKDLLALDENARPTNYDESVERLNDILARYTKDNGAYVKYAKKVVEPGETDEWVTSSEVGEEGSTTHITETLEVDANGELVFRGLAAGTYTITEIKAPNGYNMLTAPIGVVISCEYVKGADGLPSAKWTAKYAQMVQEGGEYVLPIETDTNNPYKPIDFDGVQGMFVELKIENSTGALLPSTGGIGTTIFYVAGSILVLAAVVLLVTKKRMSREK